MQIEDKWKVFAVAEILSDWTGNEVEIFDKLALCEYGETSAVFEQYSITEWQPFENWDMDAIGDLILAIGRRAQVTANHQEVTT